MKRFVIVAFVGSLLPGAVMAQEELKTPPVAPAARKSEGAPRTEPQRRGYVIGLDTGRRLRAQGLNDVDLASLVQGIKDALAGSKPALTDEEMQNTIEGIQKVVEEHRADLARQVGKKNKEEGDRFLAANARKEGVKTTKSGLQYKVIKEGTGPTPKATDLVKTHYHGTFIGGEVFDSSVRRGEPAVFPVNRVIPGWTEALQLMKVGSKWQLFVPSDLAYGEEGSGEIPPNATLIFEVELLGIEKQASRSE
jgi:FKBP-type peptidyl-prolyl cis-trans isomerase FklB